MTQRLSDQLWARFFADPAGVRALPEARRIPLPLIDSNPDQPRRELTGIEELAEHIKEYGLLQPIVVSHPVDGRYTLIAGHRRLAAFRHLAAQEADEAHWQDIPAIQREVDTAERLVLAVAENVSRHNLNDAEVITAIQLLHDLHGWSQSEIARRLGVSRQWISQYFRVGADRELAELVQIGRLSTAKAYEVLRAPDAESRQEALAVALGGAPLKLIRRAASVGSMSSDWTDGPDEEADLSGAPRKGALGTSRASGPASGADRRGEGTRSSRSAAVDPAPAVELQALAIASLLRDYLVRGQLQAPAAAVLAALRWDIRQVREQVRGGDAG